MCVCVSIATRMIVVGIDVDSWQERSGHTSGPTKECKPNGTVAQVTASHWTAHSLDKDCLDSTGLVSQVLKSPQKGGFDIIREPSSTGGR